jgi:hypothetical protein
LINNEPKFIVVSDRLVTGCTASPVIAIVEV